MYIGTILVPAIGTGVEGDPQRPDINLTLEGEKWTDIQAAPYNKYVTQPSGLVIEVTAELATFQALESDPNMFIFGYDEVQDGGV